MNRTSILKAALVLAIAISLVSCAKSASKSEQQKIKAVTANDYVPLNFIDPATGQGVGYEYDLINEIGKRLGVEVEWEQISWDAMIQSIREGQFDVAADGISITEERKKQVDYSRPYLKSAQFMLVRADENRFANVMEFKADESLIVGAQAGNTNYYVSLYDIFDGDENTPRLDVFDNFGLMVQALLNGDVDMVLMDAASSRGYIGANGAQLKIVGEPMGQDEFGLIFTKGSKWVSDFDKVIAELDEEGFLADLENKWFYEYNSAQ